MLAIHYSPVKNTRQILCQGITKTKRGTFCFPMTGNLVVDKWWAQAFRAWHPRTQYNGFVFRVNQDDLPAAFGHWLHGGDIKPLLTLSDIEDAWRDSLLFRIGERSLWASEMSLRLPPSIYRQIGRELVAENPRLYTSALDSDPAFLKYVFEDYELVLSRSIEAKRILRVVPGSNQSGQNIARTRKSAFISDQIRDY